MSLFIGIDLSTNPKNTAIAVLTLDSSSKAAAIKEIVVLETKESAKPKEKRMWVGTLNDWVSHFKIQGEQFSLDNFEGKAQAICCIIHKISGDEKNVTVAIDVPFGWPVTFKEKIAKHQVGESLLSDTGENGDEKLAYRKTDLFVKKVTNEAVNPFSVSSDKIGRTAVLGSILINKLTQNNVFKTRLLQRVTDGKNVIEVYPTATLAALREKKEPKNEAKDQRFERRDQISTLIEKEKLPTAIDKYDAVIAAYTAFLYSQTELCFSPLDKFQDEKLSRIVGNDKEIALILNEGWIWMPKPPKETDISIRTNLSDLLTRLWDQSQPTKKTQAPPPAPESTQT